MSNNIQDTKINEIIPRFIVGMSRSGTTWMGKCLNEHPDTAVFGESLFWGRAYLKPEIEGSYSLEQIQTILNRLSKEGMYAFLGDGAGCLKNIHQHNLDDLVNAIIKDISRPLKPGELFLLIMEKIAAFENKSNIVEKTPHHVNWVEHIVEALPNSRFIIMVRDPYSFMLSYKHQGDRYNNEMKRKHHLLYHPFLCAFLWRGYIKAANKAINSYPQQTLLVKTEEIKTNPQLVLNKVQSFFLLENQVDLAAKIPCDNSSFSSQSKPSLESEDIFWMNLIAGREITQSFFQIQSLSYNPFRIMLSILKLPYWAVWSFFHLWHKTEESVGKYLLHWFKVNYAGNNNPSNSYL